MKVPHFRVGSLMLAVAIVALDLVALRATLEFRSSMGELLLLGALPMANVLAVGLLTGLRRPGSRPSLLGFVPFGAAGLALYVSLAISFSRELVNHCMRPVSDSLADIIPPDWPLLFVPAQTVVLVLVPTSPQVNFS